MPDNQNAPSQVETIRILASIQTTNEFILKGMTELKTEMGKVGEVVQAHAILLQAHSLDIGMAKREALDASQKVEDLQARLLAMPVAKSNWSTDNVKAVTTIGAVLYVVFEIAKMLLTAAIHPNAPGNILK